MGFPLTPVNGQTAIVNGIKYIYISAYKSWRRDFNNVLDRLYLIGGNETVSSSTGDLVVLGGGYFGKSVIIGRNLTVYGTATFYGPIFGSVSTATNIAGGTPGALIYQVSTGTTGFIAIGATGTYLVSDGTKGIWTSTTTATNIAGGGQWQVPFQTAPSTTAFSPDFTYNDNLGSLIIRDFTTSAGTDTGAIVAFGGVGIGENLNVGGNVTVGGNFRVNGTLTYLNTTNLDITDKLITLAKGSTTTAIASGAGFEIDGTTANFTYSNAPDKFTSSVRLDVPSLRATAGIAATNVNTGTVQVTGGVGVTGNVVAGLFVGPIGDTILGRNFGLFSTVDANGQITAGSSSQASFWNTTTQQLSTTASIYSAGGIAVEGASIIKGFLQTPGGILVNSTTTQIGLHLLSGSSNPADSPRLRIESRGLGSSEIYASSATNSRLVVDQSGSQNLWLDSNQLWVRISTPATDTTNGSIRTNGGISATGNVYIGGHHNGIKLATGNIYPDNSQSLTINTTGTGVLTLSGNSILINAVTSATFNTSTFVLGSLEATRFNEIEVSKGLGSISRVRPSLTNNNLFLVGNGSGTVFIGTASRITNVVGGLSVNETATASRFNDLVIDYSTSTNLTVYPFNTNQGLNIQGNGTGNIGLSATRVQVTATTVINGPLTANSFNDLTFTRSGNSATVTISSLLTNQNITISPNGTGTTTISSNLQVGGVIKETVLDLVALQSGNNVTLTTSNIIANIITANPTIATSDVFLPAAGAATSGYRLLFRNRSTLFSINVRDTSTSFLAVISTVSNRTIVSDGFNWFVQ